MTKEKEKMTPARFQAIRARAGLSAQGLSDLIGLSGGAAVRKIEAGTRGISGPVAVLMELLEAGKIGIEKN